MCKFTNVWTLFCIVVKRIILVFLGVRTTGIQNTYILQVRYEPHLSDKAPCSDASHFSNTKIWHAQIYSYFEIGLKPAVVSCLNNAIASPPIALESCSRAQTDRPVILSALEKKFLVGGCRFFVSDVISEVVFGLFWLMLPGLGPNH